MSYEQICYVVAVAEELKLWPCNPMQIVGTLQVLDDYRGHCR
jgi:hypothetical protein